ncbi:MAG: cation:proton antiporter subunit C [Thermoplasmata archaeon]|nr:cation:proton antiporter subunit C [Thermoplasmata archaeon]
MLLNLPFITVVIIMALGLYAMLFKRNLIKIVIGLSLIESGVNLFLVSLGYRNGGIAPIYTNAPSTNMVLPTPQALTLTSIVIGVATTAMLLSFCMVIYRHYGTLDSRKVRRLRE